MSAFSLRTASMMSAIFVTPPMGGGLRLACTKESA